jgi:hypothetical protein
MTLTIAAPAAATPWQKAWGDYDSHLQWHDAGWWLQNRHAWVTTHHPEWTESYAEFPGQIGDYDRLHVWHYGDGGLDRQSAELTNHELTNESRKAREDSSKPDVTVKRVHNS